MQDIIISGKLEEFPIESIVQLVYQDKKDGILHLDFKKKASASIHFDRGEIVFVESEGFENLNFLKNYLTHKKRMKQTDLNEVGEFGKKYDYTFEQALYAGKYIEKEEAYDIINKYFEDILCDVLSFKSGAYRFELTKRIKKLGTLRINSDYIIMEAGRRIDIKKIIFQSFRNRKLVFSIIDKKRLIQDKFNVDEVVEKNKSKGADSSVKLTDLTDDSSNLLNESVFLSTTEDKKVSIHKDVIVQLNGVNNVNEIIVYSGWSEYRVLEVLNELYTQHYIECIGEKEETFKTEEEIFYTHTDRAKFILSATVLLTVAVIVVFLRVFGLASFAMNLMSFDYDKIVYNRLVVTSVKNFYTEKVDYAKKIYYISNNEMPAGASVLYRDGYITGIEYDYYRDYEKE